MFLGLDLGTSGLKGCIVNENGQIIAQHNALLTVIRPYSGWSEQNPLDWIKAAKEVLNILREHLPSVKAIGLSGQMHGATCLDKSGDVIRPAILWNDTRADAQAQRLEHQSELKDIFGNITFAGFTAPKILWMRAHERENYTRIDKILLPKDYLRYWLTGEFISDLSDASGTAWLDPAKRDWSDALLSASGLTRAHMPALCEGSEIGGYLRVEVMQEFGFAKSIPVAGGAGDNAASAMGLDIIKAGKAFISLGTSGVVFAANASFQPAPETALHAFCHAVPNIWHQMGVTLSATDSLNWLAKQFQEKPADLVNQLNDLSSPTPELFMPFLGGERTPYNAPFLRASFHHIAHETDRQALTRAVLEGVCFSLKTCLELMEASAGHIETLLAVGGGAQSQYWMKLLATVLDRPIFRPVGAQNAAAIGAARLGAMSIEQDINTGLNEGEEFTPSHFVSEYQEKYLRYQAQIKKEL